MLCTCSVCEKIFSSSGRGGVCASCERDMLDVYPDIRRYIRENPRERFTLESLSENLSVDMKLMRALADAGFLDRDLPSEVLSREDSESERRNKIVEALRQSMGESGKTGKTAGMLSSQGRGKPPVKPPSETEEFKRIMEKKNGRAEKKKGMYGQERYRTRRQ